MPAELVYFPEYVEICLDFLCSISGSALNFPFELDASQLLVDSGVCPRLPFASWFFEGSRGHVNSAQGFADELHTYSAHLGSS